MWEKFKSIVPDIFVGSGVINNINDWASAYFAPSCLQDGTRSKKILVVCDPNTYRVAGERVISSLKAAEFEITEFCFPENEPVPNEYSVGRITAAYTPDTGLILGVGSGTINDLCTYVGAAVGCKSAIVGTAPSMDGYASLGSAMLFNGIKVTPPTQTPVAIFCDTDILTAAPMRLIAAGLGDMLGKITSLADWRLSHILTGEPMPRDIYGLMEGSLNKIIESVSGAAKRDPKAIESITEGLILSGIAMSLYGDSRPASGTEHHLAHFWEMCVLAKGQTPALHGIKVGLATVIALLMWKRLAGGLGAAGGAGTGSISADSAAKAQDGDTLKNSAYEQNIRRIYGQAADTILQTKNPHYSQEHIKSHLKEIQEIASSLPSPDDVLDMLSAVGVSIRPKDIGLSADTLQDSIIYARDRKKTFTLLQLLGSLDLLEDYSAFIAQHFAESALSGVKCFVLDMDGTIYLGNRLFSYTHDFLKHLDTLGKNYVFFTNNSSQNAAHYIKKLQHMGISVDDNKLLMSTHVLLDYLDSVNAPRNAFVAGTKALRDDFTAAGYALTDKNPDFTVLGFDMDMDFERLTMLCDFIRAGLPVYGVNTDYNCPVDGGFIPDCGSLAAAVHASTGVMPEFFGKPSRHALNYIMKKTGYREDELCFVGDRLYTDIAITDGTAARSVLVLSGETNRDDLLDSPHIPDIVADDLRGIL